MTITVEPLIKDPPRKDTACTKGYFSTYEQSSWSRSVLYDVDFHISLIYFSSMELFSILGIIILLPHLYWMMCLGLWVGRC